MTLIDAFEDGLPYVLPILLAIAGAALVFILAHWMLIARHQEVDTGQNVRRQVVRLLLTIIVLISIVFALSLYPHTRESAAVLAGLLGIVVSAAITISSATFISNAMAGLMLRAVGNFGVGDYIQVADKFGRVSERGIFHVEIQTENRDLATLPNLYLVNQPVTVVRASGTIISTTVSLGYNVSHSDVESALRKAALDADLADPFVYILELGDFSVNYQIAGFLAEVKHLLSARSRLRTCVIDALHAVNIEIVSPTFMNQRQQTDAAVIASTAQSPTMTSSVVLAPEDLMFDKAQNAEQRESLDKLEPLIADLESQIAKADDGSRTGLETEIQLLRERRMSLEQDIAESSDESDD